MTARKVTKAKKIISLEKASLDEVKHLLNTNSLSLSLQMRTFIFMGIIFLMTVKPDIIVCIITFAVSLLIGIIPLRSKVRQGDINIVKHNVN